jgi:hypothetical protein
VVTAESPSGVDPDQAPTTEAKYADAGSLDQSLDRFEEVLAAALRAATEAGQFDLVGDLARALQARRQARSENVVALPVRRRSST